MKSSKKIYTPISVKGEGYLSGSIRVQEINLSSLYSSLLESPGGWNLSWRQCPWKRLRPHRERKIGMVSLSTSLKTLMFWKILIVAQKQPVQTWYKAESIAKATEEGMEQYWKASQTTLKGTTNVLGHLCWSEAISLTSQLQPWPKW